MRTNTQWLTAFAVVAMAGTALAADRRVPSNDYPTIQAAVDAANDNDRIVLGKGVYNEAVTVTGKNGLTFTGSGAIWEAVGLQSDTCLMATGDRISITGLRFRHGNDTVVVVGNDAQVTGCVFRGTDGESLRITGNDASVTRCRIVGSDGQGVQITGTRARVCRNTILQCNGNAVDVTGADAVVERNTIVGSEGDGIEINGPTGNDGHNARVQRNKIIGVSSTGVDVNGDDANITRNIITLTCACIDVSGNDAVVESNRLTHSADDDVLSVNGDRASIRRNRIADTNYGAAIDYSGNDTRIESNRIANCFDCEAICASGDQIRIVRNRIANVADDSAGIVLTSSTLGGSANSVVERNVVVDVTEEAFDLRISNSRVRSNNALRCGINGEHGYLISGDDNEIEGNRANEIDSDGYNVRGDRNLLRNCTATDCYADGFDIASGNGNELANCKASDCDGEGLDNGALTTIATNCTFSGNRLDVAAANPFQTFTGNRFSTGGESTAPEVD